MPASIDRIDLTLNVFDENGGRRTVAFTVIPESQDEPLVKAVIAVWQKRYAEELQHLAAGSGEADIGTIL